MYDVILDELTMGLPDARELVRVTLRLVTAMLLGATIGYERERAGKSAGLRTHMLVSIGAALFVIISVHAETDAGGLSRVVQGIATGIGFIGTGAILKRDDSSAVKGLTTAAGIWMTAAVGVAAGVGQIGIALLSVTLGLLTLAVFSKVERWAKRSNV